MAKPGRHSHADLAEDEHGHSQAPGESHGHNHMADALRAGNFNLLLGAFFVTLVFLVVEVTFGLLSNSLALLSDAAGRDRRSRRQPGGLQSLTHIPEEDVRANLDRLVES